jgi:teichuronic acid biosynthesis glycosyltransferase TuaG
MQYEEKKKHISIEGNPLVSIITPMYNAEDFIAETLSSVKNQTYSFWEHIVVDDGSNDNSVGIVTELGKSDNRITLITNTVNNGAAICRNQATNLAKGKYIAFLDADDLWHPEKLEKQLHFMTDNDCDVSFTSYQHIGEKGNPLAKRVKALSSLSYKKQHRNNYIGNLTGIYKVAILGKIMAPNIRKRQDWAVWLEAIKRSGKPALGLQEDLSFYRVRQGSISANKINLIKHNFWFYNTHLKHSWPKSVYYLLRFFWEYFIHRPKQIERL